MGKEIFFKTNFLSRNRKLDFSEEKLIFDDSIEILNKNINGFRFGLRWISGYKFTIGRTYFIEVKDSNNFILKIKLKSIYGINSQKIFDKYSLLLNTFQDFHFDRKVEQLIEKINNNETIQFKNFSINNKNVSFSKKKIDWKELESKKYYHYYSIKSKSDKDTYKLFYFEHDWDAIYAFLLIENILKRKTLN